MYGPFAAILPASGVHASYTRAVNHLDAARHQRLHRASKYMRSNTLTELFRAVLMECSGTQLAAAAFLPAAIRKSV
jgi:hypothetical protein